MVYSQSVKCMKMKTELLRSEIPMYLRDTKLQAALKSLKMRKKLKCSSVGGKILVVCSRVNSFLGQIEPLLKMVKVIAK